MLFVLHVNMHMFFGKKNDDTCFYCIYLLLETKAVEVISKGFFFIEKTVPKHYKTFKIFALNNLTKNMELDRGW